jgi:hypothetical protein
MELLKGFRRIHGSRPYLEESIEFGAVVVMHVVAQLMKSSLEY